MKFCLISLGCSKNTVDSEHFLFLALNAGYTQTDDYTKADLILVNTCGFIYDAKEESVNTILEIIEEKKENAKLVVTGCLVKRYKNELEKEIVEVNTWLGLKDFAGFAELVNCKYTANRSLLTPKHYAYLRISDGCNNNCTYCAIPLIRGKMQSVKIEEVLAEANELAEKGVKELILLAQDTAAYGMDIYGKKMLPELLNELCKISEIEWVRLLYLHPAHITEKLVDTMASQRKILPYFEIPLQHINNRVLAKMNRHIDKAGIEQKLEMIKNKIENAVIRTTFIVGFPGETEKAYTELKEFVAEQKFGRMGVFVYSREEDTKAESFNNYTSNKKAIARKDELMSIQQKISEDFLQKYVGKNLEVIIDGIDEANGHDYVGRTYFDAPDIDGFVFINGQNLKAGDIVLVTIEDAWEYDLTGTFIKKINK